MELLFSEEQMPGKELGQQMERAAQIAVAGEGLDPEQVTVSVTFTSPEEIRQLNDQYRGKDAVTDVLSFPQFDDLEDIPEDGELCLGDVVICMERAEQQAWEFGHSLERELLYLFVHSIYHLLGYDHMEEGEKRQMRAKEEAVMEQLGLSRSAQEGEECGSETRGETNCRELYLRAREARKLAYAPFSQFRVGAALLCEDGQIFTGVNVENSSYGATICAERTALVKAISEGHRSFQAIAIASDEGAAWPCGICRQMLYEFAPTMTVVTGDDEDSLKICQLKELLPNGFRLEPAKKA